MLNVQHAQRLECIVTWLIVYTISFQTGIVTISIDANFGLCRRRAAGNSVHPPIAATKLFFDQDEVDQFVTQYDSQADTNYNNQVLKYTYLN